MKKIYLAAAAALLWSGTAEARALYVGNMIVEVTTAGGSVVNCPFVGSGVWATFLPRNIAGNSADTWLSILERQFQVGGRSFKVAGGDLTGTGAFSQVTAIYAYGGIAFTGGGVGYTDVTLKPATIKADTPTVSIRLKLTNYNFQNNGCDVTLTGNFVKSLP